MQDHVFNLKPSRYYLAIMSTLLILSDAILIFLPLPGWILLAALWASNAYGWVVIRKFGLLLSPQSILRFKPVKDKHYEVTDKHHTYLASLSGESIATRFLILLLFKRTGAIPIERSCLILRDSLKKDDYRRLMVLLKLSH